MQCKDTNMIESDRGYFGKSFLFLLLLAALPFVAFPFGAFAFAVFCSFLSTFSIFCCLSNGGVYIKTHTSLHMFFFFRFWQASMSAATQNLALDLLQNALSSRLAYAVLGSVQSLTHEGARTMWRDGQHCAHAPSTSMRGVVEQHTLPECLMFVYPAVSFSQKIVRTL